MNLNIKMNSCHNHNKCIEKALIEADSICVEKNLRFTDLRKKVFEIISQNHSPIKAYDILELLQKEDSSAKPSTVYRALDFLLENGLVHKLHSSNSYAACGHPAKKHGQCYFLICNKCNSIKECCSEDLTARINEITDKDNFLVKNITVEIDGICGSCH